MRTQIGISIGAIMALGMAGSLLWAEDHKEGRDGFNPDRPLAGPGSAERREKLFDTADADGDGNISKDEFMERADRFERRMHERMDEHRRRMDAHSGQVDELNADIRRYIDRRLRQMMEHNSPGRDFTMRPHRGPRFGGDDRMGPPAYGFGRDLDGRGKRGPEARGPESRKGQRGPGARQGGRPGQGKGQMKGGAFGPLDENRDGKLTVDEIDSAMKRLEALKAAAKDGEVTPEAFHDIMGRRGARDGANRPDRKKGDGKRPGREAAPADREKQ